MDLHRGGYLVITESAIQKLSKFFKLHSLYRLVLIDAFVCEYEFDGVNSFGVYYLYSNYEKSYYISITPHRGMSCVS